MGLNFSLIKSICNGCVFSLAINVSYGSSFGVWLLLLIISGPVSIKMCSTFGIIWSSSIAFKSFGMPLIGSVFNISNVTKF